MHAMEPARAYTSFVALVMGLSARVLDVDQCRCLRDAADARLFGDDDSDLHDANADCLLLLLETQERAPAPELEHLRIALEAISPVAGRRAA
jgi:hypothetical protein